MEVSSVFPSIFFLGFCLFFQGSAIFVEDKRALLYFVNNLPHLHYLNWVEGSPVCSHWTGVTCSGDGSRVVAVRLPGVGFNGPIPPNTIGRLSELQILSLRSNGITGPLPSDFLSLKKLSSLYLQFNNFSGPLPFDFSAWKNLTTVNLSNNAFNGTIPHSLSSLTHLTSLNLANNSLSGEIPDLNLPNLQQINLSNNKLTGIIPKSLQNFPSSVFMGNNVSPVSVPPASNQPNPESKNPGKLSEPALIGIVTGFSVLGFIGFVLFFAVCCLRRRSEDVLYSGKMEKEEKVISRNQDAINRLFFFEGCNYAFDLEDLLRASADVLGKGTFGMTYKAILEDAIVVVVKRLKEVGVGKREFEQQMEIVGNIKHENVVELRAYYYSKDERLLIYDYHSQGSLAALLHDKRGENRMPLDWETRLRIAIGAARGIARIHEENGLNGKRLIHGNIKSSNIFLNSKNYGCISDIGLSPIMTTLPSTVARSAGYIAPEWFTNKKYTQPGDVYSFGVVLLELLTGKSPRYPVGGEEGQHLVRWVRSVVREEWTAEVFDMDLLRYPNIEEEMVEMLQIAMACVHLVPDVRPKMPEVVKMIEGVRVSVSSNLASSGTKSQASTPRRQVLGLESPS